MEEKYLVSESEEIILTILQEEAPLTMQEIVIRARQKKEWSDSTIKTFVRRMVKKGAILEERRKVHVFAPAYGEEARKKAALREVVDKFFKGSYQKALLCFCETEQVSEEELREVLEKISEGE